jgi:hypothetical protein
MEAMPACSLQAAMQSAGERGAPKTSNQDYKFFTTA